MPKFEVLFFPETERKGLKKGELFVKVQGSDTLYVSNYGRFYSAFKEKMVYTSTRKNPRTKIQIGVNADDKPIKKYAYRIVAEAFCYRPKNADGKLIELNKLQVHHIDENPRNNRVENLIF